MEALKYFNNLNWGNILWDRISKILKNALKNKADVYKTPHVLESTVSSKKGKGMGKSHVDLDCNYMQNLYN